MKKEYDYVGYCHYNFVACPKCGKLHKGLMDGYRHDCSCGATLSRKGSTLEVETPDPEPAPNRPIIVNNFFGVGFTDTKGLCDAITEALRSVCKEGK